MTLPNKLEPGQFTTGDFIQAVSDDPEALVYFLCNIGDGDAQVLLLPKDQVSGTRRAVVVDAGRRNKLADLLDDFGAAGLLPIAGTALAANSIALIVATHPHHDHIAGIPQIFERHGHAVAEFWDPGYYHPVPAYHALWAAVEQLPHVVYTQPASGMRRFIGSVGFTVLAPSINLRNRFDTYGVDINNASISLRVEFPAGRVVERDGDRVLVDSPRTASLILGADAQTLSWSHVLTDFPYLQGSDSEAARAIRAAVGRDLLRSQVLKVSHHASKRGINLELVERISPALTLVSSVGSAGAYNFPHAVAQEILREARQPIAGSADGVRDSDSALGIFYTADAVGNPPEEAAGEPAGTIGVVMKPGSRSIWRFFDEPKDRIQLAAGKRWNG